MELLDALDEGMLAIDREERIIYINRAAAEMLSFDKSAVLGKPLSEVYPQSTIPRVMQTKAAGIQHQPGIAAPCGASSRTGCRCAGTGRL